jgi:hypothetical protein
MRIAALFAALLTLLLDVRPGAAATEAPWCQYDRHGNIVTCSQPSQAMCLFTVRGSGGTCYPNPNYRGPPEAVYCATQNVVCDPYAPYGGTAGQGSRARARQRN